MKMEVHTRHSSSSCDYVGQKVTYFGLTIVSV